MILDFRDPAVGTEHTADVCIVGSGPAGLAIARELIGTGLNVLLVESGGIEPGSGAEVLNDGENVGLPLSLATGRARTFGGTGTLWPGQCIRFDRADFQPREWVPNSGWPLSREDLDPFYVRAGAWLGIPREAADEQAWRRYGLVPPLFDGDRLTHRSSMYSTHPDVGAFYRAEFEQSDDVRVLLHATAAEIRTEGGGTAVRELEVRTLSGRVGRVRARTVVLCGGGIENARLLLLSRIGAERGLVGRYLQDHPTLWIDLDPQRPAALQEFYNFLGRGKIRYVPRIRLGQAVQREQQVLNAIATLVHERADSPGLATARELSSALQQKRRPEHLTRQGVRDLLTEVGGIAAAGFRRFARGRPTAVPLRRTRVQILLEQAPDPDSRITLSDRCDELGLPKARVDWRLTELERRTARVFADVLDAEFRRLGLGRLTGTEWLDGDDWAAGFEDAYHPIGTTRMATDPAQGVVDSNCQVHGVAGLYVCGTSVFPTSGYANPTLTLLALALRLADHLTSSPARSQSWT